jgi:hypothetical protein
MPATKFNRDKMARWYAKEHLKTDPGIVSVYYLPTGAGDREIRLIEVNVLRAERTDEALEPIDFGAEGGTDSEHRVLWLDVSPKQWERMKARKLRLPDGWSLEGAVHYANE